MLYLSHLVNALRAEHDKLKLLEARLFDAGFPSEAADIQWALITVEAALLSLEKRARSSIKKRGS